MASDAEDTPLGEGDDAPMTRLPQTVEITDVGPCKKHVKVTVEREVIEHRAQDKFSELVKSQTPQVRGFRPGKVPRKIIEQRFKKEVDEQVKNEVLMASLQQLSEENQINPLAAPELDPYSVEVPEDGPLIYEFEVEVSPEFEVPQYKGLQLRRPVKEYNDDDVARARRRLLATHGQIVPKESEVVELDDVLTVDVVLKDGEQMLNEVKDTRVEVDNRLVMKDGVAEKFYKQIQGAKVGEERTIDIKLSDTIAVAALRGKTIQGLFTVRDIKMVRLPELTPELLAEYGVATPEALNELIRVSLERRLAYHQRQVARQQILQHIAASADWELPRDMLRKQAQRTLQRRVMEMRNAGLSDEEIESRLRVLQQDILRSTALALKEHFVLQKIAELEKIEIQDEDIDDEIERIAEQSEESPRRVRARLEKDDMIEALAIELLERKALDLVLDHATYEEYPLTEDEDEGEAATLEAQAVTEEAEAAAETESSSTEDNPAPVS